MAKHVSKKNLRQHTNLGYLNIFGGLIKKTIG